MTVDDDDDIGAVEWSWMIWCECWFASDDVVYDDDIGAVEWRWVIWCDSWCDTIITSQDMDVDFHLVLPLLDFMLGTYYSIE